MTHSMLDTILRILAARRLVRLLVLAMLAGTAVGVTHAAGLHASVSVTGCVHSIAGKVSNLNGGAIRAVLLPTLTLKQGGGA